jgi:hypothetical protein
MLAPHGYASTTARVKRAVRPDLMLNLDDGKSERLGGLRVASVNENKVTNQIEKMRELFPV